MKTHKLLILVPLTVALGAGGCTADENADIATTEQPQATEPSIMELMVTEITPLTDTLWGIEDPQTDAEWQVYRDAADATIAAFEQTKRSASGVNDAKWIADPKWQAYADEVIAAGEMYIAAINARDMDAIFAAGDALYTPCENCHLDFNPAVQAEQY